MTKNYSFEDKGSNKEDCPFKDRMDIMYDDVKSIKSDVKSLLAFKWHTLGGAAVIGIIIMIIIGIIPIVFKIK